MSRHSRTRVSRPLIAALGVTIAVGGGVSLYKLKARGNSTSLSLKAVDSASQTQASAAPSTTTTPLPANLAAIPAGGQLAAGPATQPAASKPAAARPATPNTGAMLASLTIAPHLLDDARAKFDAGDLPGARELLNDPLVSGRLSPTDADAARKLLSQINQTLVLAKKSVKDDGYVTRYQIQSGDRLSHIADKHGVTWELLCRINGLQDPRKIRAGQWIKVPNGPFYCVVTKSAFRLDVYLHSPGEPGSLFITSLRVGLGKDNSTPTGTWMIQQGSKAHPATYYSPRGEGVMAADDPKNPLGGYWMGLAGLSGNAVDKSSYGIHGTIEPDSIGKQASMGCIRLGHDDIALLYDLLVDGKSKVVVKD